MLAEDKLSHRKIAKKLGVSRGFVDAVANRTRPDRGPSRDPRKNQLRQAVMPPRRCAGCRHLVYILPCVECQTRKAMAASPSPRNVRPPADSDTADADSVLRLNLTGKQRTRYERIHDRLLQRGPNHACT